MIPVQSLLNSLQAWAQEELAGQRRMLTLIERQERALCVNDPAGLSEATQALEPELAAQSEREAGRWRKSYSQLRRFAESVRQSV